MEQEVLDAPTLSTVKIYNPIEQGIALMLAKHGHVLHTPPVVTGDPAALALAKDGRKEMAKFRTALEKARKEEKAESLAYGRLVDSEAARIQAVATPLELAYDKAVTDEEARLAAIREAELQAERQRIEAHRARIQSIREVRETAALCRTAERLQQLIDGMPARMAELFEEFQGEAEAVFSETLAALQQMHAAKVEAEFQAAEIKRQQEELARQRLEQEAQARTLAAQQAEIEAQKAALAPAAVGAAVEAPAKPAVCEIVQVGNLGAPADSESAESSPPTLRLGRISAHLGFAVTADFLRGLGFEPAGRERAAVLYHASSWPLIRAALVKHISTLPALQAE